MLNWRHTVNGAQCQSLGSTISVSLGKYNIFPNHLDCLLLRDVNTGFLLQTGFRLLKTGVKPVFSYTGFHRNFNFKPS